MLALCTKEGKSILERCQFFECTILTQALQKKQKNYFLRSKKILKKKNEEEGQSNQALKHIVKLWSFKILFTGEHEWTDQQNRIGYDEIGQDRIDYPETDPNTHRK